jgi:hypothetical protein
MGGDVMQLIDEIDWGALRHNYGAAHETAAHLRALTSAEAWRAAYCRLDTEVFHSGYPGSANAPVTRVVAMMLAEEKAAPEARQALVEFLGFMAVSTRMAEKRGISELLPSLERAMQQSYLVVLKFLDEPDLSMRRTAVDAAIVHVGTRGLAHHRPALAAHLRTWARTRREERVYWVGTLADLDEDTEEFLVDENAHVRVAAALSPALANNAVATDIIIDALFQAAQDCEFDRNVYYLTNGVYGLPILIKTAIARVEDLQRIAIPAAKIARHEKEIGHDTTWGPLMCAIFHPPYSDGAKLTPVQREFLAALVENVRFWKALSGNTLLLFRDVGLPPDRDACARLVEGSQTPRSVL